MVQVDLYCDSLGTHLMQIYSGLYLLHKAGEINLNCRIGETTTDGRPNRQFIMAKLYHKDQPAKEITCLFDMQDSPKLGLPKALEDVDFYIKRSLESESYEGLSALQKKKLIPFGFNYQVLSYSALFFTKIFVCEYLSRPYVPWAKKNNFHIGNLKDIAASLFLNKKNGLLSDVELAPGPYVNQETSILFQCRLWDPTEVSKANQENTHHINQQRIQLIKELKKEFGATFNGGLQNTHYARQLAPDLISVLPGARRDYINLVSKASIVISTAGLLKSNGWKLGEYIALGKCVISEPIETFLPGDFSVGRNYVEFSNVSGCIESIHHLLSQPQLIRDIEKNNSDYYQRYLAPAAMMKNHIMTLMTTFSQG